MTLVRWEIIFMWKNDDKKTVAKFFKILSPLHSFWVDFWHYNMICCHLWFPVWFMHNIRTILYILYIYVCFLVYIWDNAVVERLRTMFVVSGVVARKTNGQLTTINFFPACEMTVKHSTSSTKTSASLFVLISPQNLHIKPL